MPHIVRCLQPQCSRRFPAPVSDYSHPYQAAHPNFRAPYKCMSCTPLVVALHIGIVRSSDFISTLVLTLHRSHSPWKLAPDSEISGHRAHHRPTDRAMICPPTSPVYGGLLFLVISLVSSVPVYIQTGLEIRACNLKCPMYDVDLELYRQCGPVEESLLEIHCANLHTKNYYKSRLYLDTGSGCWKLTQAGKRDSCVYTIELQRPTRQISSTDIRVLDPVLISNISSNGSWLGEEMAVSVQFSGEESAVTWEVDGEPLPERYRLIDDNRTLIIPSVQRDDAERRFRVRIRNPVSEEIREYRLINDTMFIRMLETEDPGSVNGRVQFFLFVAVLPVGLVMIYIVYQNCRKKRDVQNNGVHEDVPPHRGRCVFPI